MPPQGPSQWVHPLGPPVPVYLGGMPTTCFDGINKRSRDQFAALQGLFYGGTIVQTVPKHAEAPIDLLPDSFELTINGSNAEEAYSRLQYAATVTQMDPLISLVPWPHEDRWVIPATAKTEWIMSRFFSFSLMPYNAGDLKTVPRCFVEAAPGSATARVELTLVTSGLGAGEFLVDTGADGFSIETEDLSGTYAGRILMLRYFPKRLMVIPPFGSDMPDYNGLDATLEMNEVIPARSYET